MDLQREFAVWLKQPGLSEEVADEIVADFVPVFRHVVSPPAALALASDQWRQRVQEALEVMTGDRPATVHLLSLSRPSFERPPWMTEEAWRQAYVVGLDNSHGTSLESLLIQDDLRLRLALGDGGVRRRIVPGLRQLLLDGLYPQMENVLRELCRGCPLENHYFWRGLVDLMAQRIGWAVVGQPDYARRFGPMLRLHGGVFLLGRKRDEPGVWLAASQ